MALGISYRNVDKNSFLSLVRDVIVHPVTTSTTFFANAVSISAASVGSTITLGANAAAPLMFARRPNIVVTDNASSDLSLTLRIVGRRFGKQITQDIAFTAGAGTTPISGTRVIDEIVSAKLIAIAANAASDTISIGFDDSWVGLMAPIRLKTDIRMVLRDVAGTPDTLVKLQSDVTAAMVNLRDSAIDLKALYSSAVLTTHIYTVEYEAGGAGIENWDRKGLRFQT